jgi:site-specific DNA recombinase
MEKTDKFRVAFYIRVSTDEQAKSGFWLDFQKSDLNSMIKYRWEHHGWTHDESWEYIDDGYSGGDLNRPAYKRMIEDVKKRKFDIIAVWKIDRLSRSLSHLLSSFEMLQQNKVDFFSLKENIDFSGAIGKLTFQIFWALAEFERETIKIRTSEGKNASARRWNFIINSAPFGYKKIETSGNITKSLQIIPEEAEWVQKIFDMCISGMPLNGIARVLNENKVAKGMWSIKKPKFTKWYWTYVRDLVEDTAYIGNAIYKPKNDKWEIDPISIPVPQIIHPLVYEIAQTSLEKITENNQRGWGKNFYLLSWKLIDVATGRALVWYNRGKGWYGYRRKGYMDVNGISHRNTEIVWKTMDDFVWSHIQSIISDPDRLYKIYKQQSINDTNYQELLEERKKKDRAWEESTNIEYTIEQFFLSWKYDEDKRERLVNDEVDKRRVLEKRIVEIDKILDNIVRAESIKWELKRFSDNLDMDIKKLTNIQKKTLINILIDRIEVMVVESDSKPDIHAKVILRFDAKEYSKKDEWSNQKSPPLTDNLSKEGWNSEIWWRCRGSNPGPSP